MPADHVLLLDRFEVMASRNLVRDRVTDKETRVEPRIMKLLCLLIDREGQLVSREEITKEIWDDYGNADEGLTQSISYLRKILGDEQKKIIETVPKKGYLLRAKRTEIISEDYNQPKTLTTSNRGSKSRVVVFCLIVLCIALVLFLVLTPPKKENPNNPDIRPDTVTQGSNPDKISSPAGSGADVFNRDSANSSDIDTTKRSK